MIPHRPFDVFLSYSRVDQEWANRIMRALEEQGLAVWIDDRQIRPGELVVAALERGIAECGSVALIVSKASVQSGWVQEEYARAVELSKSEAIQLIPVLIEETRMPGFLANRNYVDFRSADSASDFSAAIRRLVWGVTGARPDAEALTREKKGVLLDRRIVMDTMLLLAGATPTPAMDHALSLVRCASALYGRVYFENMYGSALHALTRSAGNAAVPLLTDLPSLKPNDDDVLSSLAEDARDSWLTAPEFALELKRYIQLVEGKTTAEQTVEYLDVSLRLARAFQLAIVPHPDRWPLYHWVFDNCEDAPSVGFASQQLVDCPTRASEGVPPAQDVPETARLGSPDAPFDGPATVVSFGPQVYPVPPGVSRNYDATDLSNCKRTVYQFLIDGNPGPAHRRSK